jgi:hypothetical protein
MQSSFEVVETCLLISPGIFSVTHDFVIDAIALSPNYKQNGKTICLWIDGKKYIEKLEAQCIPFCKIKATVRLINTNKFDLYSNGDIYLCGLEYRKIIW